MYGILLQSPGVVDSVYDIPRSLPFEPSSPAYASCKKTGGEIYLLTDLRAMQHYAEAVASKCQPGVVIDLIDTTSR